MRAKQLTVLEVYDASGHPVLEFMNCDRDFNGDRETRWTIPLEQNDATIAKLLREYAAKIVAGNVMELESLEMLTRNAKKEPAAVPVEKARTKKT